MVAGEENTGETAAAGEPDGQPILIEAVTDTDKESVMKDMWCQT